VSQPLYHLTEIERRHGPRVVLNLEELSISQGEILGLVGPNGSGKSTLLRLLALIDQPDRGRLLFDSRPTQPASADQRRQVSLLLQEPYLLKRSVFENVAYGLRVRGLKADLAERVGRALDLVGLERASFGPRPWFKLSGGEAQRVALAARLALRPRVLLLDEPTASLDLANAALVKEAALGARRAWGATLVIASHDLPWLHQVSDRVLNLFDGRPMESGHLTFLFGPWTEEKDGLWRMGLPDGQAVRAEGPARPEARAALPSAAVAVSDRPPNGSEGANVLRCLVARLTWERASDQVLIEASLAGLSLAVTLARADFAALDLRPGQEVWLSFKPSVLRWL